MGLHHIYISMLHYCLEKIYKIADTPNRKFT